MNSLRQLILMTLIAVLFASCKEDDELITPILDPPAKTTDASAETETKDNTKPENPDKNTDKPVQNTLLAKEILTNFIKKEAFKKDNPWLVAQGIKALGKDSVMKSGESAIEFLLQFLEEIDVKGNKYLKFRTGAYYDTLTDANPNMILKILIDQKADREKKYETKFGFVNLNMLMQNAKMLLRPDALDNVSFPNLDWTIEVLVDFVSPEDARWINSYDEVVDLKLLVKKNFDILKKHMKSIEQHYKNKISKITRTSSILSDIDGGAHLFWSSAKAIEKGFGTPDMLTDLREQAELVFYRLKSEPFAYTEMHKEASKPEMSESDRKLQQWAFYRDMLKFYAYQLESAQIIQRLSLISMDESRQKLLEQSYKNLEDLIKLMDASQQFELIHLWNKKPTSPKSLKHVVYHDIVADSCQALRVLNNK